jgi:hypothetical protein
MRKTILTFLIGVVMAAILVTAGAVLSQPASIWGFSRLPPELTQHAQRACLYPIGGWTIIDCSNTAAAQSAQLNQFSRYVVQCGDDSYIATGDASTDEADTSDGWLPLGAWLEFLTTDVVRFASCRNKNTDSDCRYWECQ